MPTVDGRRLLATAASRLRAPAAAAAAVFGGCAVVCGRAGPPRRGGRRRVTSRGGAAAHLQPPCATRAGRVSGPPALPARGAVAVPLPARHTRRAGSRHRRARRCVGVPLRRVWGRRPVVAGRRPVWAVWSLAVAGWQWWRAWRAWVSGRRAWVRGPRATAGGGDTSAVGGVGDGGFPAAVAWRSTGGEGAAALHPRVDGAVLEGLLIFFCLFPAQAFCPTASITSTVQAPPRPHPRPTAEPPMVFQQLLQLGAPASQSRPRAERRAVRPRARPPGGPL